MQKWATALIGRLGFRRAHMFVAVLALCVVSTAVVQISVFRQLQTVNARITALDTALVAAQRKPVQPTRLPIRGVPLKGKTTAKAVIVEYSDFDCAYCGRFAHETLPEFLKVYVSSGKVLFGYRHYPLEDKHPRARRAAEAAACAHRQARFWSMHDELFRDPNARSEDALRRLGATIGLNAEKFEGCLAERPASNVQMDIDSARVLAIKATPTFVFGVRQADDLIRVTRIQAGVPRIQTIGPLIDELLHAAAQ